MSAEELIELLTNDNWYRGTFDIAQRAKFKCEYCGQAFFETLESYYSFQLDHIIPKSKGGSEESNNMAATCKVCNFLKRNWDPRTITNENAGREELVEAARCYVEAKRKDKNNMVLRQSDVVSQIQKLLLEEDKGSNDNSTVAKK